MNQGTGISKIGQLEGLRGFAALVVFFHHMHLFFFHYYTVIVDAKIHQSPLPTFAENFIIEARMLFHNGELAVWIFWTLSAYVLSLGLFRSTSDQANQNLYKAFVKRYPRLAIPIFASVLFGVLLLKAGWMYNQQVAPLIPQPYPTTWTESFYNFEFGVGKVFYFTFYQTFFAYDFTFTLNPVLWTINFEFWGSLLIFALFGIIRRNPKRFLIYALIAAVLCVIGTYWALTFLLGYVLCDYRHSELSWRTHLSRIQQFLNRWPWLVFLLSCILLVEARVWCADLSISNDFRFIGMSFLMLYLCIYHRFFIRFFGNRINVWLGKVSFSFYLIHLPIICSLSSWMMLHGINWAYRLWVTGLTLVVSLTLAYFFYKFVDNFAVRISGRLSQWMLRK